MCKLKQKHLNYINSEFFKLLFTKRDRTLNKRISNFFNNVAQFLIDDEIFTDDYEKQSEKTPLLIPNVNFSVEYEDDVRECFYLKVHVKDQILNISLSY